MTRKLIIFGNSEIAELAKYYFEKDTEYEIAGFCVDPEFLKGDTFCDKPIVSFDEVQSKFSPEDHSFFVALSYTKLNTLRREKFESAKALGYQFASYISPYATVLNNGKIGENCFILEDNTIQPFVSIGDNVTLWSGNHIGHHSTIKSHCFISSHVVISGGVTIDEQCFVGVNSTLRDGITIGEKSVIGAGAIILGNVESSGVYIAGKTERSRLPSNKLRGI
ncbi:acetyltransferase [Sneathiella litorea]|uniref:Transferase n=1 Tax=Sneathiella litorea TaxID=2606216 RepID=A0A6L8W7X2_9PROT|nr:acetyltransferase [Sneathiella litorea]MZR30633.1 transferase [Sneathiella litorea]